mmetsp:Transcript_3663/g.11489  ORF Transcript_3663/g.11489 Transcript_3663/m.11489 type:complete len:610 (-) Transcript_3663:168-1997(-)
MASQEMTLQSTIGFNGKVAAGLQVHPDREHLLYPLGSSVIVEEIGEKRGQKFLQGHTGNVTCIAISKSGKLVASGEVSAFDATIILWDFATKTEIKRLTLHKNAIQCIAWSPSDKYLVSLGGPADGTLTVWETATGKPLFNKGTSNGRGGNATCCAFANRTDDVFVVGGNNHLRVWSINPVTGKAAPKDVVTRGVIRDVTAIQVDHDDVAAYAATTTGDVMQFDLQSQLLKNVGPDRAKFQKGACALSVLKNGELLVGSGSGTVALVKPDSWKVVRKLQVEGAVTSIGLRGDGHELYVGTDKCSVHRVTYADFAAELRSACSHGQVNDVMFPAGASELFATCAGSDITIWHTPSSKPLLQISVPGHVCKAVAFNVSGTLLLSGWDDGTVRAFLPETGKLKWEQYDASGGGVNVIVTTSCGTRFVTGGADSQIRMWQVLERGAELIGLVSEHAGEITSIMLSKNDEEAVSSSLDGSCIIWDLTTFSRKQIIMANSLFMGVQYRPDEGQVLTVGTDRKVAYWETFDGSLIREVEVSKAGAIQCLDIAPDGAHFVVGGEDKLLKFYSYRECERKFTGIGHAGAISALKICPNMKHIVSVGKDGSIFRWAYPA